MSLSLRDIPPIILKQHKDITVQVDEIRNPWPEEIMQLGEARIYDFYPYLFFELFPGVGLEKIRPLALAGKLYCRSLFWADNLMDEQLSHVDRTNATLSIQSAQFESYQCLHELFFPQAAFWSHFRTHLIDYTNACILEQQFRSGNQPWSEYTESVALNIVKGKTGIAKVAIAGLAEMAGDDEYVKLLEEALEHYYIARQMLDDVCDWKEDMRNHIPSLLLSRIIGGHSSSQVRSETQYREKQLAYNIYYQGHAQYVIDLALDSLDDYDDICVELPDFMLNRVVESLRKECRSLLSDIEQIIKKNLRRTSEQPSFDLALPRPDNKWQQLSWDSLEFLVKQWKLGFGEARHIMQFPRAAEFRSSNDDFQYTDIFQRALIADVLCDADELLDGQLKPLIDYEVNYLLSRRRSSGIGGWSYFPNVPEIPPDADDLGQIMQVLLRSGHKGEIEATCGTPLEVLLTDRSYDTGAFSTWIIPNENRTPEEKLQAHWAEHHWDKGHDNEVMANLLYALSLYDREHFSETIDRGISFIETQQEDSGSWRSTWYHGPYYGTYVCVRVLMETRPSSPSVAKALAFLCNNQNVDGGWGENGSDPLSTSLAMLALAQLQQSFKNGHKDWCGFVDRAYDYLIRTRGESDIAWPSCPLIFMGKIIHSYGSRTLTTTFIAKAAMAWYAVLNRNRMVQE